MSRFCGVLQRDGRDLDEGVRRSFASGVGHCARGSQLELWQDRAPAAAEAGALLLAGDLRLDNAAELRDRLALPRDAADDRIALAAYARWGEDFAEKLLGDFSLALWDDRRRELLLACDILGAHGLYLRELDGRFWFANRIEPLVRAPLPQPALSLPQVAAYLRDGELYHETATLLQGVQLLPGGCVLRLGERQRRQRRYWSLGQAREPFSGDVAEAARQMRQLLQQAVSARVPGDGPVGAHLSGGLDSSAIVSLAAPQCRGRLQGFSWMPPPADGEDRREHEWAGGEMLAQHCGLPLHYNRLDSNDYLELLLQHDLALGDTVDLLGEPGLRQHAAASGIGVMLSGWGGDQFATHHGGSVYASAALRGHWRWLGGELLQEARSRATVGRTLPRLLRDRVARPLQRSYLPAALGGASPAYSGSLECAGEELVAQAGCAPPPSLYRGVHLEQAMRCPARRAHLCNRLRSWYAAGLGSGIHYRYPLLDRRLLDFTLSLPPAFFRQRGYGRYVFRLAVQDLPPRDLWWRNQKWEPRRVRRSLALQLEAARAWLALRGDTLRRDELIDGAALRQAIDTASLERAEQDRAAMVKFLSIRRAILVHELAQRYRA